MELRNQDFTGLGAARKAEKFFNEEVAHFRSWQEFGVTAEAVAVCIPRRRRTPAPGSEPGVKIGG